MASDESILAVRLEARIRDFERNMQRANRSAASNFGNIEKRASQMNARINQSLAGTARSFAAPFLAGVSLRGAQSLIDSATRVQNALKVAGLEGEELSKVYDRLYASAQKNAAPLESLVTLYGRVALVQNELGVSSEQIVSFADNVALSLRVAGTDANAASGALLQLSQALGSGVVRAEEFNSILEGAPTILQAAAAGIKEAGGSVATLRKIMLDGELSSKALFDGFNAGSSIMEDRVAGAALTLSQRFVRLQNVLEDAAGRFNEASAASEGFGNGIDALASYIERIDMAQLIGQLDSVIAKFAAGEQAIYNFASTLGKNLGLDKVGELLTNNDVANSIGLYSGHAVERRMSGEAPAVPDALQDYVRRTYGDKSVGEPMRIEVKPKQKQISLADYAVTDDGKKKGKGSGRSKSTRERADEYERLAERIADSTAETIGETEALRGLNPLVNDYGFAVEKARAEQELLTAAQKAGKTVTPQLRSEIAALAEQYATATSEAAQLTEAQDKVRQSAEDAASFNKDMLRGIVDGFVEGKKAADIFADATRKLGERMLDLAFNSAFDPKNGFLSSLFGGGAAAPASAATGGGGVLGGSVFSLNLRRAA